MDKLDYCYSTLSFLAYMFIVRIVMTAPLLWWGTSTGAGSGAVAKIRAMQRCARARSPGVLHRMHVQLVRSD
jgi:hypothetical protein